MNKTLDDMADDGRSIYGPANRNGNITDERINFRSRKDEELDEELRAQLRKKNEEGRKYMNDRKSGERNVDKAM